ncbi:MAG TPA: PPOX class F420-dependent oxidoreductase [Candidatus Dormibacteraeota bacterium]|nr:PPOX class F420-dependent oxidoreductase [Candidatus Dormibacteraeota bacterium]
MSESDREILKGNNFAHLTTLGSDGAPISTVVWVDEDGGEIIMNTAMGRIKQANIARDPRVAVSVHRQDNPQMSMAVVGVAMLEQEQAEEIIDRLTKKYTGQEHYPVEWRSPDERRVTIRVRPQGIHRYGY